MGPEERACARSLIGRGKIAAPSQSKLPHHPSSGGKGHIPAGKRTSQRDVARCQAPDHEETDLLLRAAKSGHLSAAQVVLDHASGARAHCDAS